MRIISRKLALAHLAINEISQSSEEEIEDILFADYLDEEGAHIEYSSIYTDSVQEFLLHYYVDVKLKGYSNKYLQAFLTDLYEENMVVMGNEDALEICPCCHYQTLSHLGNYDVCPLCHWEDDGKTSTELDSYSFANQATLREYRKNFEERKRELNNIPYRSASEIAG